LRRSRALRCLPARADERRRGLLKEELRDARAEERLFVRVVRLQGGQDVELRGAGPALAEERFVVGTHLRGVVFDAC